MNVVIKAGCILINKKQRTIALVVQNGEYSFPKGHLEKNETIEECAIRETIEETGHDVKILKKLKPIKYKSPEDKIYENHYFIGIDEGKTNKKIEDKDKEEVEWHQFEEIEETLSYTYLKEFWKVIKNDVAKLLIENKDKRGK